MTSLKNSPSPAPSRWGRQWVGGLVVEVATDRHDSMGAPATRVLQCRTWRSARRCHRSPNAPLHGWAAIIQSGRGLALGPKLANSAPQRRDAVLAVTLRQLEGQILATAAIHG